jgi:hypothetical protein
MLVMLSRKPQQILMKAAFAATPDDAFWILYDLSLSFSKGGVL